MSSIVHSAARIRPPTAGNVQTPVTTGATASTAVAVDANASATSTLRWVTFYSAEETFVLFGPDSTVNTDLSATTDGFPIPASQHVSFLVDLKTERYFSTILASGSGTLYWYLS